MDTNLHNVRWKVLGHTDKVKVFTRKSHAARQVGELLLAAKKLEVKFEDEPRVQTVKMEDFDI